EATKFTEVGYVGRDVESMIRDLTEISLNMVKSEHIEKVQAKAESLAEERLLDLLLPSPRSASGRPGRLAEESGRSISIDNEEKEKYKETRERLRLQLKEGKLDNRYVDIEVREKVIPFGVISNIGLEELEINLKEMLGGLIPEKAKRKKAKVPDALRMLVQEEANKLIDTDKVTKEAIERV
ncbi:ATP-dependent HslUV protease ATP-binding subunit HslU, partial [Candidatus Hakubella thermalkaliphila]